MFGFFLLLLVLLGAPYKPVQLHYDISGVVTIIINKACPSRSFCVWANWTIKEDIVHENPDDDNAQFI